MTDYPDHDRLTRYLLGSLPAEEVERLDELSIADNEFAAELSAVENDLVDAYVRGELAGDAAAQFRSAYSSTPKRRQKLAFAETLFSFQLRAGAAAAAPSRKKVESASRRRFFPNFWIMPQWAMAGVVIALLAGSGYLTVLNRQLRERLNQSEAGRASLASREQDLEHDLETKSANAPSPAVAPPVSLDTLRVASFMLAPSLRGAGPLPVVSLPRDADLVVLKLELESGEFAKYRVTIEDAASRQDLWHSTELKPFPDGDRQAASFAIRPGLLKPKNYVVQLKGIRANGSEELVSTYPFRTVVK